MERIVPNCSGFRKRNRSSILTEEVVGGDLLRQTHAAAVKATTFFVTSGLIFQCRIWFVVISAHSFPLLMHHSRRRQDPDRRFLKPHGKSPCNQASVPQNYPGKDRPGLTALRSLGHGRIRLAAHPLYSTSPPKPTHGDKSTTRLQPNTAARPPIPSLTMEMYSLIEKLPR
jgi:hypothetical protein